MLTFQIEETFLQITDSPTFQFEADSLNQVSYTFTSDLFLIEQYARSRFYYA